MDYKGVHGVLARVLTCSALTAPAQPAGQSRLALMKPNKLQNQLQGFCKEPCEGRTCWPVCSRVPEHGCPQKGDLGESATTQALYIITQSGVCAKHRHTSVPQCPPHAQDSIISPGNMPRYHSPGSPFHDTQGCPMAAQGAGGTLMRVCSVVAPSPGSLLRTNSHGIWLLREEGSQWL